MNCEHIKAGDVVAYWDAYARRPDRLYTVDRVTATQIIIKTLRFRRKDGRAVGESGRWGRSSIELATPEQIEQIQRADLIDRFHNLRRDKLELLDTKTLTDVWELLNPPNNESTA